MARPSRANPQVDGDAQPTSEAFWMNLQSNYELRLERRALRDQVDAIAPLQTA